MQLSHPFSGFHVNRVLRLNHLRRITRNKTKGADMRDEIRSMADIFRGKIIDVTPNTYIVEMTGTSEKLDAFIAAIDPDSIIEAVRSGPTGISRGEKGLHL
jgi:acetolactate synthase-1/3 small subunit